MCYLVAPWGRGRVERKEGERKKGGDCMGDSERSLPPEWETRETSGLSNEGVDSFTTAFRSKGEEWWAKAELQAAKLITSIQPNPASETRRLAVAAYVTKVIKSCINCEVSELLFVSNYRQSCV